MELKLNCGSLISYSNIHRHRRALPVASELEVHFPPLKIRRQSSDTSSMTSDTFSMRCISFRFILSSLNNSSSLRTLTLSRVKVAPAHHRLILEIQTLRKLVL